MRRAWITAITAFVLFAKPARADALDAVGVLVTAVVVPAAAIFAIVMLAWAVSIRERSRGVAVGVAAIGLAPGAAFGGLMYHDEAPLFWIAAAFVAGLFALPRRPRSIE